MSTSRRERNGERARRQRRAQKTFTRVASEEDLAPDGARHSGDITYVDVPNSVSGNKREAYEAAEDVGTQI